MANPQRENGHLDIANEIAEALTRINLSAYQSRILWAIWRKTYGWQKKIDWISNSQLCEMTGMDRRHVARAKKELLIRQIVIETDGNVGFNKDYTQWKDLPKEYKKSHRTVIEGGDKLSSKGVTSSANVSASVVIERGDTLSSKGVTKDGENEAKVVIERGPVVIERGPVVIERGDKLSSKGAHTKEKNTTTTKETTTKEKRSHTQNQPWSLLLIFSDHYNRAMGTPYLLTSKGRDLGLLKKVVEAGVAEPDFAELCLKFFSPDHVYKGNCDVPSMVKAINRLKIKSAKPDLSRYETALSGLKMEGYDGTN